MNPTRTPWITIHITHTAEAASRVRDLLESEGFMVKLRPISSGTSDSEICTEILVLQSESQEARSVLVERGF